MQMHRIVKDSNFPSTLLDGLDKMIDYMPDLGSEIYVNVKLS